MESFSGKLLFAFCLLLFIPFLVFCQNCKDERFQFTSLSNQLGNLNEFIDVGYCKQIKDNQNSQEITVEIKKKESITEKISVHFNLIFISLEGRPASLEGDVVFEKNETVKRGFGINADAQLQLTVDRNFCVQCRVVDIADVILEDVEINYQSGPHQDEVISRSLPGFDATSKVNSKPITITQIENPNVAVNPGDQKTIQSIPSVVNSTPLPANTKSTGKNSVDNTKQENQNSENSKSSIQSTNEAAETTTKQGNPSGEISEKSTVNEQTVNTQTKNSASQNKDQVSGKTQQVTVAPDSKTIVEVPQMQDKSAGPKVTENVLPASKESKTAVSSKANPASANSVTNEQSTPQIAQIPETPRVPFQKEEYELKVKQKVDQLQEYLQRLTDKKSSISMTNRTIEQCLKLFLNDGKDAIVGVSSINSPTIRKSKVRDYLVNLSRLPYQKVEITWSEIFLVDNFKLGPDSNYHATVSFQQTFKGFNDNNMAYGDLTHKNIDITIKPYSIIEQGVNKNYWEILLGDIRVSQTDKAK